MKVYNGLKIIGISSRDQPFATSKILNIFPRVPRRSEEIKKASTYMP
jgi:hypothetical protein